MDVTTERPPEASDGLPPAARRRAMVTVALSVTMAVLDISLANIALPAIAADLHSSPAEAVWVINAYQLTVTVLLLPMSSLGDIYGYRRVYKVGLALFVLASLCCALSSSLPMLTAARVLQGMGAAGIMSVNTALVRFIFPRAMLGRALGINAFVVAVSSAAGPSIAAGILSIAPWPALFAINVPIGIVALLLTGALPRTPHARHKFDVASGILNGATFGLFIAALDGFAHGEGVVYVLAELAVSIAIGIVFVRRQFRLSAPMLPVDLFRIPIFSLSVATSVCCYIAQSLGFIALPFLFQVAGGMSQIDTGLLITPWPLIVVVVAPIAGRLSDKVSAGLLGGVGLAGLAAGLLLLAWLPAHPSGWNVAWRMMLCGAGFGLFQAPNNRQLLGAAPRERSGAGSGMLATSRLLGQTTGGALVAVSFGLSEAAGGTVGQGAIASISAGAVFAAVAAVVSVSRLTSRVRAR
jgi:DHA2 family multidrug resistance protein-like MFS transporter